MSTDSLHKYITFGVLAHQRCAPPEFTARDPVPSTRRWRYSSVPAMARGIPLLSTWTGEDSRLYDFDSAGGRPAELLSCHHDHPRLSVLKFGEAVTTRVQAAAKAAAPANISNISTPEGGFKVHVQLSSFVLQMKTCISHAKCVCDKEK